MELMPVIRIASRPIQPASANEISVSKRYRPVAYARRPGHAGSKSKSVWYQKVSLLINGRELQNLSKLGWKK